MACRHSLEDSCIQHLPGLTLSETLTDGEMKGAPPPGTFLRVECEPLWGPQPSPMPPARAVITGSGGLLLNIRP